MTTVLPKTDIGLFSPDGPENVAPRPREPNGVENARGADHAALILAATVAFGFALRLSAARHLSSHVDEAASILAAQMTAERGAPILPWGALYLQGALLSYLLTPLMWLGHGDAGSLFMLRLPSVIAGTIAVLVMFRLCRVMTGSATLGLLGAFLLAIDPVSVRWSAMVRMYALLQCLSLVLALMVLPFLLGPGGRRRIAVIVGLFWLAVFTHIAVCLLLPAMAVAAALLHGRRLLLRRDLLAGLAACAVAPFALLGLNRAVTAPGRRVSDSAPFLTFVGEHLLSARRMLDPDGAAWIDLFRGAPFAALIPAMLLVASGYLVGRTRRRGAATDRGAAVIVILSLYWVPILLVATLTGATQDRYLLHVHAFGFVLLLLAIAEIADVRSVSGITGAVMRVNGRGGPTGPFTAAVLAGPVITRARRLKAASWSVRLVITVTVAVAAVVRAMNVTNLSLWLDEGFTALYAGQPWDVVSGLHGAYSPHPPLFFVLTKVVSLIAPEAVAGRIVSVAAGIATVPVLLVLIARLAGWRAAVVGSLVVAVSPLHVYYSQEARMYALVAFLVAVSYLALTSFALAPFRRWAATYGLATSLAFYADYSAAFALLPQAVVVAVLLHKLWGCGLPLVVAGLGAALAYVPWIPQVIASTSAANRVAGRDAYLGAAPGRVVASLLSLAGVAGDGSYLQSTEPMPWNRWPEMRPRLLVLITTVATAGILGLRERSLAALVTAGLIGTISVTIVISEISPAFGERTILPALLGWALLAGAAMTRQRSRR